MATAVDSIPGQFARAAIFGGPPLLRLQQRASLAGAALLLASILVSTPAAAAGASQDEQTGACNIKEILKFNLPSPVELWVFTGMISCCADFTKVTGYMAVRH